MKKLPAICLALLPFVSAAKDSKVYHYQKKVIKYNARLKTFDTSSQKFSIIKRGKSIFIKSAYNALGTDTALKYAGDFYSDQPGVLVWRFNKQVSSLYKLTDTITTDYDGKYQFAFLKGQVYNSGQDTTIHGHKCVRFIRTFKGNPGRDSPNYNAEEYVDLQNELIVFQRIKYSNPFKEIWISLIQD
ncbi:MAG: hypothetical protein JNL13_13180 [Chitinophagaceae bacterium]|nr:hypothetical protein [Chitinophagaceae bacterium]